MGEGARRGAGTGKSGRAGQVTCEFAVGAVGGGLLRASGRGREGEGVGLVTVRRYVGFVRCSAYVRTHALQVGRWVGVRKGPRSA